jgi:hypothetical protein
LKKESYPAWTIITYEFAANVVFFRKWHRGESRETVSSRPIRLRGKEGIP